jgi:putative spermidine/putrescine transport system ATP-binding protein
MRNEIRDLQQRLAITTVFVTHDQQEALAMADRVAVMSAGKLVEVGPPKELCDHPVHPFTASFLGARTVIEGSASDGVFTASGLRCKGAPERASRLVLRAARLRFAERSSAPLDLAGVVIASAFVGDVYETDVDTAAGRVRLLTPSDTAPPPLGTACHIQALPGGVSFIR